MPYVRVTRARPLRSHLPEAQGSYCTCVSRQLSAVSSHLTAAAYAGARHCVDVEAVPQPCLRTGWHAHRTPRVPEAQGSYSEYAGQPRAHTDPHSLGPTSLERTCRG